MERILKHPWSYLLVGILWFFLLFPPLVSAASSFAVALALLLSGAYLVLGVKWYGAYWRKRLNR